MADSLNDKRRDSEIAGASHSGDLRALRQMLSDY
jgi:hypothetical protein